LEKLSSQREGWSHSNDLADPNATQCNASARNVKVVEIVLVISAVLTLIRDAGSDISNGQNISNIFKWRPSRISRNGFI